MRKIGILTFHRSINYGAFLQAFTFSNEIKKRFPDNNVEIIDFQLLKRYRQYKKQISLKRFPVCIETAIKHRAFKRDQKKLLLSKERLITDDQNKLLEYIKYRSYDIIIVGSDAVWAYQKMKLDNPYWLFGEKLNNIIKMSYAASAFSTDFKNVSDSDKSFIKNMLNDFQYIGVRDTETYNFIKEIQPEKEIHYNCDPTFFLPKNQNIMLANKVLRKHLIFTDRPLISFMVGKVPYINELKNHLGNKYRYIHLNHRNQPMDIIDNKTRLLFNLSPLEWYAIYSKCVLNISDYFHGAVLGLINRVPTVTIDKTDFPYPYIGKYEQVMTDLGLDDYLFHYKDLLNNMNEKNRFFAQVDYALANHEKEIKRINRKVEMEKEKANSFFSVLKEYL